MSRQRALPARWVRGPERLTIIAGALLLMLSTALLILGWRYVAAANTNLRNAEQSAQTYVGRVSENVANLSQITGFGTAAEALAPALAAPDASHAVADAMVERAERYVEACTCTPPRAQHVAVLSGKTGRLYEAKGVANAAFPLYAATALRALVDTAPVNLRTVRAIPFTNAGYLLLARVYHSSAGTRVGAALTYSIEEFRELAAAHAFSRHIEAAYAGVPDRDSLFGIEFRWGSGELLVQRGWSGDGPSDITEIGVEPNVIYSIRATLNPAMAHLVVNGGLDKPPTGLFLLFGIVLVLVAGTGLLTLHRARQLMTARTPFADAPVRATVRANRVHLFIDTWRPGPMLLPALSASARRAYLLADPGAGRLPLRTVAEGVELQLPERAPGPIQPVVVIEYAESVSA
ncbi:MAG: hypothetical protein KF709_04980 [Gemmatimonadaceae bacterium]|nr:hypothetical protein [Gemmatimonadaceae bacterium]